MTHTIAHVALVVRTIDEAIAFYAQKLGFTLAAAAVYVALVRGRVLNR